MKALPAVILLTTISLSACTGRLPFQPPLAAFQAWQKPGASRLDTKKALLECGMPHPHTASLPPNDVRTPDQQAEAENCLLAAGYTMTEQSPGWCALQPELPACQPGVEPLAPSVERRLGSHYCRARLDMAYCRKTASNPSACTEGPVEPECLP
ncbi:hypothetical protein [Luteimonas sp. RC10]|uniref:hypothetical protein n=1 Tax=Luteimonas sp. RC10 TaxID=2587035 RepID=UPI001621EE16|nr:hypothetical protein [Luteimonas sp. RC10]MBB3342374.1 hypothetical protein [Luteimonas sp. RC10]